MISIIEYAKLIYNLNQGLNSYTFSKTCTVKYLVEQYPLSVFLVATFLKTCPNSLYHFNH